MGRILSRSEFTSRLCTGASPNLLLVHSVREQGAGGDAVRDAGRMHYLAELADLVWPRRCVACGAYGVGWCAACLPVAGVIRLMGGGVPVVAAGSYDGAVRAALIRYKERGRRDLATPLAALLSDCLASLLVDLRAPPAGAPQRPPVLVPVPSSRTAAAARGGSHVVRLARRSGARVGLRTDTALSLARRVEDSAGLGAAARADNLHLAMTARGPGWTTTAILVDDIVTTGATLREAVRALRSGGWTVLGAAVVAATARDDRRRLARAHCADTLAPPT